MEDITQETPAEKAETAPETWVKSKMTLSLSKANRDKLQAFVDQIPATAEVDNFTKLVFYMLFLIQSNDEVNAGNLSQLQESIDTMVKELQGRNEYIFELQTEIETLKETIAQQKTIQPETETETSTETPLPAPEPGTENRWFWQDNLK